METVGEFDRNMNISNQEGDYFGGNSLFAPENSPPRHQIGKLNYQTIGDPQQRKRVRRAYRKHSSNVLDWANTIKRFKEMREKKGKQKIMGPKRSLVELQEHYQNSILPDELQEFIDENMSMIEQSFLMHQNSQANQSQMSGFGMPLDFDTLNSVSRDEATRDMYTGPGAHNMSFVMGQTSHGDSSAFLGVGEDSTQRNFFSQSPRVRKPKQIKR